MHLINLNAIGDFVRHDFIEGCVNYRGGSEKISFWLSSADINVVITCLFVDTLIRLLLAFQALHFLLLL